MNIVIFTGGNPPEFTDFMTFYSRIVEEDDIIIAADSGLETLIRFLDSMNKCTNQKGGNFTIQEMGLGGIKLCTRIKPSYILGDMDSLKNHGMLKLFPDAEVLEFDAYKDLTDTELSLIKAHELNPEANVILVGGNGGRPDHFIGILETFSSDYSPSVWLCGPQVIYKLSDGQILTAGHLKEKDCISIARVFSSSTDGFVRTEGLEWGDECMRKKGMPSISNKVKKTGTESVVTVSAEGASFLVFLPYSVSVKVQRKDR